MTMQVGALKGALIASTTFAGGDALNLANPEGADLLVTKFVVDVTTPSTGAASIDAGIATTGVSNDNLIDGADVNAAAKAFGSPYGTNGAGAVKWPSGSFLTVTPTASLAGLVANYYIEYIRA